MSPKVRSEVELEIAHILFLDTVGYSKLLINEQRDLQEQLNRIVRSTDCFRTAEAAGKLIRLPTGDGMALVFADDIEAPLRCALEISRALRAHPHLPIRMGIHSGPVSRVADVNDRMNIAGAGVNIAQQVMSFGDAGHILLSKRVADDLAPYRHWQPYLHDLGQCEIKHGAKLNLVSLHTGEAGNAEIPARLKQLRRNDPVDATTTKKRRAFGVRLGVAAVILGVGLAFLIRMMFRPEIDRSIAVLPFRDFSPAKDQEYFTDGIAEQISNSLAKIHGLFVVARTSAFAFKNRNEDVRDIGRRLHVSHMLEGSVNRSKGRIRVDAQLIDVSNGFQMWSESYDSGDSDLFSLQKDVAQKVASALQVELHLADVKQLANPATNDPEAYDFYLRGLYLLNKRTVDGLQKARALFEQAIQRDSRFALGHAGLADAYLLLGGYGAIPTEVAARAASPEISATLAIDDNLAEGHVSRAMLLNDFEWNWSAAETEYRRAIELNPNSATAHHWYALNLAQLGRFDDALEQIAAAQKQDPLAPIVRAAKAKILCMAHRYKEAVDQARKGLELETDFAPSFFVLTQAYSLNGEHPAAIESAKKYAQLTNGSAADLELAYAFAAAGNKKESEEIVREVSAGSVAVAPYDMATICSAWRDNAAALRWLGKAIERRAQEVVWIRVDPRLDIIRSEPRFGELLKYVTPVSEDGADSKKLVVRIR